MAFCLQDIHLWDTSSTGLFTCYLDISPTRLFTKYNIGYRVARLGKKVPIGLLWQPLAP